MFILKNSVRLFVGLQPHHLIKQKHSYILDIKYSNFITNRKVSDILKMTDSIKLY